MGEKQPQIVQYQGSKRLLAPQILKYMPEKFNRLIEPFSGMAAITVAAAMKKRANVYHINDLNRPLIAVLQAAIENPQDLLKKYMRVWTEQFDFPDGHVQHFYKVRSAFNEGEQSPENMLYLIARCVKGAVRYGRDGKFNQSPDKRRHGTNPQNMARNVYAISQLLSRKSTFSSLDYRDIFRMAKPGDIIYMDPPYQGVTDTRDHRYFSGVAFEEFSAALEMLNQKGVDFLISYDGACGGRAYGKELPQHLGCTKIMLQAGRSSQSTLLGRNETTVEALYISRRLAERIADIPVQLSFDQFSWEPAKDES